MEFNNNKSIYLQICDAICEQILSGKLGPDERIPSVREYGAEIGVNPNTIMRSYEKLTADGSLRGVSEDDLGLSEELVRILVILDRRGRL